MEYLRSIPQIISKLIDNTPLLSRLRSSSYDPAWQQRFHLPEALTDKDFIIRGRKLNPASREKLIEDVVRWSMAQPRKQIEKQPNPFFSNLERPLIEDSLDALEETEGPNLELPPLHSSPVKLDPSENLPSFLIKAFKPEAPHTKVWQRVIQPLNRFIRKRPI